MKTRFIITTKDIARILGCSLRKAQAIAQRMKYLLEKEKYQFLTVKEFAAYMGLEPAEITLEHYM